MSELIKILENHKWYDNPFDNQENHISASSFANETLELWMSKYNYPKQENIGDNTIGSLVHMGMENLINDLRQDRFITEARFKKEFSDYIISGSIDLLDTENKIIYDYKTAKNYSKKMLKKEGKNHRYAIQLAIYNWLLSDYNDDDYTCKILWIMKDSKAAEKEPVFVEEEIEIMSRQETEQYMYEKIIELNMYDKDVIPDKCKDLWIRKVKGVAINSKCEFYCSFKSVCPHYKISPKNKVAMW